MKEYTLDGEPVDVDEFIADNSAPGCGWPFTADEVAEIRALQVGDEITCGGGAAAVFVLRRIA